MGEFDKMCSSAVRGMKRYHPELDISLVVVLTYMTNSINTNRDYYETYFDDILIPTELADVHYKAAISRRNQWFVDHSDYLIDYVYRDFGGAYTTLKYATRQREKSSTLQMAANNDFAPLILSCGLGIVLCTVFYEKSSIV